MGELSFIRIFTDMAVLALVPLTVLTVLGWRWLWASIFPLFYLLFAIPVREPFVDMQVNLTARFTHLALKATGFPVYREGQYFELPTGKWSIAEACSCIEYFSVCMMFTVLFAWIMFASMRKRIAFVIGAAIVGISGNWLRAYLTIGIAHLTDNLYLRNGHGTFGWIIFAVLLFAYCAIGWHFCDVESTNLRAGHVAPPASSSARTLERATVAADMSSRGTVAFFAAPVAVLALLSIWPVISITTARDAAYHPFEIETIIPLERWTGTSQFPTDWMPKLVNPSRERIQFFEKNGVKVGFYIGVFANQTWNSKLVSSVNHLVAPESTRWSLVSQGVHETDYLGRTLQVKTADILGGSRIMARRWYWTYGTSTANDIKAKIEQWRARLDGRANVSAWLVVCAVVDSSPDETTRAMDEFMREMGPSLERALEQSTRPENR